MKRVRSITSIVLMLCLMMYPMKSSAAQVQNPPVVQEYTTNLGAAPDINSAWMDKKISLGLGEYKFECRITDLASVPVRIQKTNDTMILEMTDDALLGAWLKYVNEQLASVQAAGTETVYNKTSGAYEIAQAGSILKIRPEFKDLLKGAIQLHLAAKEEPTDIIVNLNDGFLVAVPVGGENVVAGICTTSLKGSSKNRISNITLAASRLNNYVLNPGEILSVSDALLPRTPQNGYLLAGVYQDGETVPGYGGGICQISSTLYNAAMNSGLSVVERHPHSMTVSYLRAGLDAAIASGLKDLRIQNNYAHPITILAQVEGKNLSMSVVVNENSLEGKTYKMWSEIPKANSANTYLSTYLNGVEIEKVFVGRSNYRPHGTKTQ